MRVRASYFLFSFAFALAACADGHGFITLPANMQRQAPPIVSGSSRSAQSVTTNTRVPLDLSVFIPCANGGNGEDVDLSGNLHLLTTTTINVNSVHVVELANPQGITGVGSITGEKYQGTGVTREGFNVANTGFPLTFSFTNNFRIIGQKTGDNFLVHENSQLTINANGQVTVSHDHFSIECK